MVSLFSGLDADDDPSFHADAFSSSQLQLLLTDAEKTFDECNSRSVPDRVRAVQAVFLQGAPATRRLLVRAVDQCHLLTVETLAAATRSCDAGDCEAAATSLQVPRKLSSMICRLLKREDLDEISASSRASQTAFKMLLALFSFFRDQASGREEGGRQAFQTSLREVFAECKLLMDQLERCLDVSSTSTMELLADLLLVLPHIDFRYYGKMGKAFLAAAAKLTHDDREDSFGSKAGELFSSASEMALSYAGDDERLSTGGKAADNLVRKLLFVLKFLRDLCDLFCDCLGREVDFGTLVSALAKVLTFSTVSIENNESVLPETRQQMTMALPGWAKSVAEELMIDQNFTAYVLNKDRRVHEVADSSSSYAFCSLCSYLLHRLPHKNDGTRSLWMPSRGPNLLGVILKNAHKCHEFDFEPFVLSVEHSGRGRVPVSAYEHIISLTQSFIMGASVREMEVVERELLRAVVTLPVEAFWSKRLASDVWCFLGRYGSAEYCLSHVTSLMGVLRELPHHHRNWQEVRLLTYRLSSLLAPSGIRELEENLQQDTNDSLLTVVASVNLKNCSQEFKLHVTGKALTVFAAFSQGDLFKSLQHVTAAADVISQLWHTLKDSERLKVKNLVVSTWKKLSEGGFVVEGATKWCLSLFSTLMALTQSCLSLNDRDEDEASVVWTSVLNILVNSDFEPSALCILLAHLDPGSSDALVGNNKSFMEMTEVASKRDAALDFLLLKKFAQLDISSEQVLGRKLRRCSSAAKRNEYTVADLRKVFAALNVSVLEPTGKIGMQRKCTTGDFRELKRDLRKVLEKASLMQQSSTDDTLALDRFVECIKAAEKELKVVTSHY